MAKRLTQQEFITLAESVHGSRYDYSQVEYVNFRTKVIVGCKEHGPFQVAPHLHTSNGNGCPKCNTANRTTGLDDFIKKCATKFDINYLDFSNTTYKGLRHPITIACVVHGDFTKTRAGDLLDSKGCPVCAKRQNKPYSGFGLENPHVNIAVIFYLVKFTHKESGQSFHKVGITKHSVAKRFRGYAAYDREILHLTCWSLNDALALERKFSDRFTQTSFKFPGRFNGKTECYDLTEDDLAELTAELGESLSF